jgi:ABC-type antimicrobial peptide transport system permease subunit
MLAALRTAFAETLRNLRANFFQTFLSVLGIIIGVGALVTMLALIDGLERAAREGIAANSSTESVMVRATTSRRVDGINVAVDDPIRITAELAERMEAELPYPVRSQLFANQTTFVQHPDTADRIAIQYVAISLPVAEEIPDLAHGRFLTLADQDEAQAVTVINRKFAERLVGEGNSREGALGVRLEIDGQSYEVVGILDGEDDEPAMQAVLPLAVASRAPNGPPTNTALIVNFDRLEDVRPGRDSIEAWFAATYPYMEEPVQTIASLDLVKQMEIGFKVFRLVMAFLIGIAVVVGGVGVMNVLLMSINERTSEIGVRKAVGANRRRIITQFLAESVAISAVGSFFGMLLGVLMAIVSAATIGYILEVEFSAVFRAQTLVVVGLVALITGIVFGTYPARRAAGLDPVRAIQRT